MYRFDLMSNEELCLGTGQLNIIHTITAFADLVTSANDIMTSHLPVRYVISKLMMTPQQTTQLLQDILCQDCQ